jgi:putative acetyltransferase
LRKIEEEARGAGKSVLRLETGTYQQEAIGLYERMGFRPRDPFGPYTTMPTRNIETSLFLEKVLG